jgi:hypothetical protein
MVPEAWPSFEGPLARRPPGGRPDRPSTVAVLARQIAAATPESAAEISAYPVSNGLGSSSLRGATFNNRSAAGDRPEQPTKLRELYGGVLGDRDGGVLTGAARRRRTNDLNSW